ncbi:MAG TPA: T9SS type A sorting domain-containing protein, partial [Bacteroidia bacterium]|nr:T9SS type A sorting domain-containing protein [Bacteroidia bacterium]
DESKERHFTKWPILGVAVWANPSPVASDYAGEISNMKSWIQQRLLWLDGNIPGVCTTGANDLYANESSSITIFPNPVDKELYVELNQNVKENVTIEIFNIYGKLIRTLFTGEIKEGNWKYKFDLSDLSQGVYFVQLNSAIGIKVVKL